MIVPVACSERLLKETLWEGNGISPSCQAATGFCLARILMKLRICVNNWVNWNSLTFQLNFRIISSNFCWLLCLGSHFFFCQAELINFSDFFFFLSFVFIHIHNRKLKVKSWYQLKPLKVSFFISVYGEILWQAVSWKSRRNAALAGVTELFFETITSMSSLCKFDYSYPTFCFMFIWTKIYYLSFPKLVCTSVSFKLQTRQWSGILLPWAWDSWTECELWCLLAKFEICWENHDLRCLELLEEFWNHIPFKINTINTLNFKKLYSTQAVVTPPALPCDHVHNLRWSKYGLALSCCCNPTDLQGLLVGFVFSWDFLIVSSIGLGVTVFSLTVSEPSQKLHTFFILIFRLFLTSLAEHLYLPTVACIWLRPSVGTVLMFYFWFHLFIRLVWCFFSDINKIFKLSCKHWYLIYRVLSNNVVFCPLRVPRHHLSSCFFKILTAKLSSCPCAPVCWSPLHLLPVDSIFLMLIPVALLQSFWNAGNYLGLYFSYVFCNTSFCISLAFWLVKSLLNSYSYDLPFFSFVLKCLD